MKYLLPIAAMVLTGWALAQSTIVRARPLTTLDLVQADDLWRATGTYSVPANGTLFITLPGNVATLPGGGIILQDGLSLVLLDVQVSGAEQVDVVRAAQAGPANQALVYGFQNIQGYHSALGVLVTGESANGVGLGLRKAVQGGADVAVTVAISGRVAN